jgi:Putative metal-binding motif/Secretion system C-terminal sorting domain
LYCFINQLSSINLNGLYNLIDFRCSNNQITSLNVYGFQNLDTLDCRENQITCLNLGFTPALTYFLGTSNPNLGCITVDNVGVANSISTWYRDATAFYDNTCVSLCSTAPCTTLDIPTFNPIAPICAGATVLLPTISTNTIIGFWSPAINNLATTTYTFTPHAGQCATTTTMTIVVNPIPVPPSQTINVSITNDCDSYGGIYNYDGILNGKNSYAWSNDNSYKISFDGVKWVLWCCNNIATTGYLNTSVPSGLFPPTIGWTVNPSACISGTLTINFPYNNVTTYCAGATVANLAPTNTNLLWYSTLTGGTALSSTTQLVTGSYYGSQIINGCESNRVLLLNITVNPPTNTTTVTECGEYYWSVNGVTYTTSGTYTFVSGCTTEILNLTITPAIAWYYDGDGDGYGLDFWIVQLSCTQLTGYVSNNTDCDDTNPLVHAIVTPTFTQITPICTLTTVSPLPTTSLNGVTGTWSPAFNNATTPFNIVNTTYTFTPDAGQCATTTTMTLSVYPLQDLLFTPIAPICAGDVLIPPPNTSSLGITGTWSPAFNNLVTTTYTFTPDASYCAVPRTVTITVNPPNIEPQFTQVAPICAGATLAVLPTTSNNSTAITGTWSPALNNLATTTYTFTPTAGQCATTATMKIVVNPSSINTTTISACDSYNWNGTVYTTSGIKTGATTNCITEKLDLTITPSSNNITIATACDSYTWNGTVYTTSGIKTGTTNNCVTEKLDLTINNSTTTSSSATACNTYTWPVNGSVYTSSGIYTSVNGCVTEILNLTIQISTIWYQDLDGDSFGSSSVWTSSCTQPIGYVGNQTDCNDNNASLHGYFAFYPDNDGDGYGGNTLALVCATNATTPPTGYSLIGHDCNDNNPLVHGEFLFYVDFDSDGFGSIGQRYVCAVNATTPPNGFATNALDCNDTEAAIHPGAVEIACDGVDNNCNGIIDEGSSSLTTSLRPTYCGTTLNFIYDSLGTPYVASPTGSTITGYRFKVKNLTTNAEQVYPRGLFNWFRMTGLSVYDFNTTYEVSVALELDNVWLCYGPKCQITTPGIPIINQCGQTILAGGALTTTALTGVTQYTFYVTNLTTGITQTFDKPSNILIVNQIPGYNSTNTYSVCLAIKTANGTLSVSGVCCLINPPPTPRFGVADATNAIKTEFEATGTPNPFESNFTLNMTTKSDALVKIVVYDMIGKQLETKEAKADEVNKLSVGDNYPSGVYNVIVSQGENVKSIRMIKR